MHQNESNAKSTVELASAGDSPASSNPVQAGETPALPEIHEIAFIFPPMRPRDFEAMKANIKLNGLQEAIWIHQGKVIDGRHRLRACHELGIAPAFREWDGKGGSLLQFVISQNLHRRQLRETQRAMIAARMLPKFEEEAKQRQGWAGTTCSLSANLRKGRASDEAGKLLNVGARSVEYARKVLENGCPALIEAVERCKIAVSTAATIAERSHDEQKELLALDRKAIAEALRSVSVSEQTGRDEGGATATMPQAPPPDIASAKHSPIMEQRIADDWLLANFRAGNAKLTKDEWGFRLEFSDKPIDDWRAAMSDERQLFRMIERGFRVVWKKGA